MSDDHCDRCGNRIIGEPVEHQMERDGLHRGNPPILEVCSDCGHELLNGADPAANPWDIQARRHERDPLWEPAPEGYYDR